MESILLFDLLIATMIIELRSNNHHLAIVFNDKIEPLELMKSCTQFDCFEALSYDY